MTEQIIGRKYQGIQSPSYRPGKCSCGSCSVFTDRVPCGFTKGIRDWQIKTDTCCGGFCTSQPRCTTPSKTECEIGNNNTNQNPLIKYEWDQRAPKLKCTFDIKKINTKPQILKFVDEFGENDSLYSQYCTQKVSTCPQNMSECSRIKSIGDGGDMCRQWFEAQPSHVKDSTIQNYCLRHNTEDCKCVNRINDSSYRAMKGAHVINDGCWYTACANTAKHLIPSHLKNPSCPDKLCQIIFDIMKTGNVTIENVQNDIVCQFDNPPNPPNGNGDTENPSNITDVLSFTNVYTREIIASAAIIAIIFILLS